MSNQNESNKLYRSQRQRCHIGKVGRDRVYTNQKSLPIYRPVADHYDSPTIVGQSVSSRTFILWTGRTVGQSVLAHTIPWTRRGSVCSSTLILRDVDVGLGHSVLAHYMLCVHDSVSVYVRVKPVSICPQGIR